MLLSFFLLATADCEVAIVEKDAATSTAKGLEHLDQCSRYEAQVLTSDLTLFRLFNRSICLYVQSKY